jgi:hypothetical protein
MASVSAGHSVCAEQARSFAPRRLPSPKHAAAQYFVVFAFATAGIYAVYLAILALRSLPYYRYIPPGRRFLLLLSLSFAGVLLAGFFVEAYLPVADASASRLAFYSVANL